MQVGEIIMFMAVVILIGCVAASRITGRKNICAIKSVKNFLRKITT